ncbi:LPXTG-motif cell wall-anchored protein [Streptomyces coelicolor]|nr:LPXTG cell wall anchor domain-containing protein [Streptomyces coelicolor]TYP07658.1 LPXTG-motif cell wall-anchored protein [Streptomyces coelicolor A3(2)]QKN68331.1 LPXTG cell wall anchor domain-containing protein [Streptomyces coelicolor]TYP05557.1 LPXTG-motif cell wall-anchored protein [Streptomyces coelicolor]TYP28006.1 LPXTG-motif cell wall-anchored protein [Streptomyces coelicolor]
MKLRRALAAAAATAVICPVALLAAPAASASGGPSPSPSASSDSAPSQGGSTSVTSPAPSDSTSPSSSSSASPTSPVSPSTTGEGTPAPEDTQPTTSAPANPSPSTSRPEETASPAPEPSVCEDTKVDVDIEGLPGEIAAGSGWHEFSLNVANDSGSTLQNLEYLAGASADRDGEKLFESKKVGLQAWNPEDRTWEDLDELGYAVGYIGYTDELAPDYEVAVPMRINVRADAPVGAGFTLGATIYGDADGECTGFGDVAYRFRIVAPGTDTDGTRPQEGGKAPVTVRKPAAGTPEVTGSLAATGSSSALPVIGLVGGLAVVVGGGAVFVVRRRRAGSDT